MQAGKGAYGRRATAARLVVIGTSVRKDSPAAGYIAGGAVRARYDLPDIAQQQEKPEQAGCAKDAFADSGGEGEQEWHARPGDAQCEETEVMLSVDTDACGCSSVSMMNTSFCRELELDLDSAAGAAGISSPGLFSFRGCGFGRLGCAVVQALGQREDQEGRPDEAEGEELLEAERLVEEENAEQQGNRRAQVLEEAQHV